MRFVNILKKSVLTNCYGDFEHFLNFYKKKEKLMKTVQEGKGRLKKNGRLPLDNEILSI